MPIERVSLLGAGGHAKVVLEALRAAHPGVVVRIFDEAAGRVGGSLLGVTIERLPANAVVPGPAHVAIGDGAVRERLGEALVSAGIRLLAVVHPAACVSPSARLADGVFAAATCVIGAEAAAGRGAIINHGAIVDHDCTVGDWSHVAPNATLGGGVSLGRSVMVGSGAVLLPGVRVGASAVIGAGAVVISDLPPRATVAGNPARPIGPA
jgi:sugar O-acyltransferase (sialic acid O-acetyltransferase NeuD family)